MKYTREDVIITERQAKEKGLKVGDVVYAFFICSSCVEIANEDSFSYTLNEIDWKRKNPFGCKGTDQKFDCVIIKKEPEKKLVPFDLSLKEDRDALMGKRIRTDACDMVVTTFAYWLAHGWQIQIDSENGFSGEYVLENFVFADGPNEGKPVGKEIEEV